VQSLVAHVLVMFYDIIFPFSDRISIQTLIQYTVESKWWTYIR